MYDSLLLEFTRSANRTQTDEFIRPPAILPDEYRKSIVGDLVKKLIELAIIICLAYVLFANNFLLRSVEAATDLARIPLTVELLAERLNNPIQDGGVSVIDLRHLIIDLNNSNAEFREQFYQQLRSKLNRSQTPLGIDFSESLIEGEFNASKIALPTPLAKDSLSSLLTPIEQEKIALYQDFYPEAGEQIPTVNLFRGSLKFNNAKLSGNADFSNTLFLQRLEVSAANFFQEAFWTNSLFGRTVDFSNVSFVKDVDFNNSSFFGNAQFDRAKFMGVSTFVGSMFQGIVSFSRSDFQQLADFERISCWQEANFSQVRWRDRIIFSQGQFVKSLSFTKSTFEKSAAFRSSAFLDMVNFTDVSLLEQVDFSNAIFAPNSYLNVSGLGFDAAKATVLGDNGTIGKLIAVDRLFGNENVLRNFVKEFRSLEQIADAIQVQYTTERLRLKQLGSEVFTSQIQEIFKISWLGKLLLWTSLNLLLLLSDYGTNFSLVFAVGILATVYFGLLFWFVDRCRRRLPTPILPERYEIIAMAGSCTIVFLLTLIDIFYSAEQPLLTLGCMAILLLPVPIILLIILYKQGRYHDLIDVTYFVEDGSLRQLRLLIGRLPNIPRFPFYRDRYLPILWEKHWNWLNYYDFSLNNFFKFGFNDLRVRDVHLPVLVNSLVWYQWALGLLYITLLLWTLSRTIPGLNLLIYF
jgi:hypothetical protein